MSKLAQINRAKRAFNPDLLVTIINALVFSRLHYCSSVLSKTSTRNVQKLQLVQTFATRIATCARKFKHITPSLKNLGQLLVKMQLHLRDAIFSAIHLVYDGLRPDLPDIKEDRYLTAKQETHNDLTFLHVKPLLARGHSNTGQ